MRLENLYDDVLYHKSYVSNILQILQQNKFSLSLTGTNDSERSLGEDRLYFLSLARSMSSQFITKDNVHRNFYGVFVLDGKKLKQKYRTRPVHYFSRLHDYEQEERLFTDKPFIDAIPYILEIRFFDSNDDSDDKYNQIRKRNIRRAMILAKSKGIKTLLYKAEDKMAGQAALLGVDKGLTDVGILKTSPVQDQDRLAYGRRYIYDRTSFYRKLFYTDRYELLDSKDRSMLYFLMRGSDIDVLRSELHNSRGSRVKTDKVFWGKVIKTVGSSDPHLIVKWFQNKWKPILDDAYENSLR